MSDLPDLNRRIFEIIQDTANGNVTDFARKIGLDQQKLDRLNKIDKRNQKYPAPSQTILDKINEEIPHLNKVWLLTGIGEKYNAEIEIGQHSENNVEQMELLRQEIKDLKMEIGRQADNNRELLKELINYYDLKIQPVYEFMSLMTKLKQKENS
ncbi:hypothetical protein [uncultured Chryseobacterium sp.]|uniref:hypothetical protein n=1 Tax=uncultured Chryseobacterium sp. TaxID=259322 RepID=UPI0025F43FAE|nr:hypothetical protein [uncultured Chryseobacterium sp.]